MTRSRLGLQCALTALLACGDDTNDVAKSDAAGLAVDAGGDASVRSDGGADGGGLGASARDGGTGGADGAADASLGAAVDDAGFTPLTLRFAAKVGSESLRCDRAFSELGSTRVTGAVSDFRFFVQEVYLVTSDGREQRVQLDTKPPFQTPDVALIDFTDGTGQCSVGGNTLNLTITGRVPAGDYREIVLVNGVPEALNHADNARAEGPLLAPAVHWSWRDGYRFIMAEVVPSAHESGDGGMAPVDGRVDAGVSTDDGGSLHSGGGAADAVLVHVGSAACTGTPANGISCKRANRNRVRLANFNPQTSVVVADFKAIFTQIDLQQGGQCHGVGATCTTMYEALGIDYASGSALSTQRAFRVE